MPIPVPTFQNTGFSIPAETDIRDGVLSDINEAFGGNLNTSPATPQGQLATSLAAMIGACNSMFLLFTNLVDPARTSGRMQDAIARIYFLERIPSQATIVTATLTGEPGVVVPFGTRVRDTSGNIYQSVQDATIEMNGMTEVQFENLTHGPIPAPAGTVTEMYDTIPGWDAVSNTTDGLIGRYTETPAEFETRRALSVAWNSIGSLPSILGAVMNTDGVVDAFVTENDTRYPTTIGGVTVNANSLYVAVIGGKDEDVARAIWSRKAAGAGYTGNTSVTVEDMSPTYTPPFPSYDVIFQRATDMPIGVSVSMNANSMVPANAADLIRAAIIGAFDGEDGGERSRIGSTTRASRLYCAIASLGPWAKVRSIMLGSPSIPDANIVASIEGTEMTVSLVTSGALSSGQMLFSSATGFVAGTQVMSQISGTPGREGIYEVSAPQSVNPSNMQTSALSQVEIPGRIDQRAATSAATILVSVS